jgi:hypothetical protein
MIFMGPQNYQNMQGNIAPHCNQGGNLYIHICMHIYKCIYTHIQASP